MAEVIRQVVGTVRFESDKADILREWLDGTEKEVLVDGKVEKVPDPKSCVLYKTNMNIFFFMRDGQVGECTPIQAASYLKHLDYDAQVTALGDYLQKSWKEIEAVNEAGEGGVL